MSSINIHERVRGTIATKVRKALLAKRLARWSGSGPVGPGAQAALRWLRGAGHALKGCKGVWPWSADAERLRGVALL